MLSKLTRNSETPLYLQLAEQLANEIQAKQWLPLQKLPSEHELTQFFGVSRVTVRQAFRVLVDRGLVVSRQGKGVYVRGPRVNQDLGSLRGFYDGLVARNYDVETEVVEFVQLKASEAGASGNVFQYVRLYQLEGAIIVLADITVFCLDALITQDQVEHLPVYALLQEVLKKKVARAATQIKATGMRPDIATRMGLESTAGLLQMDRTSYDESGTLLESSHFYIQPDVFAFEMEVAGPMQLASGIRKVSGSRNTGT
ncbi:GntR family transcriptional regulator [Castellaniella sp. GW247-6E4]|uniref:GntR family transcriptional regulator n=1 Tax=Castellaniella sp. GW247-6E4 TaxID=3140380 RepID=UPI00331619C6